MDAIKNLKHTQNKTFSEPVSTLQSCKLKVIPWRKFCRILEFWHKNPQGNLRASLAEVRFDKVCRSMKEDMRTGYFEMLKQAWGGGGGWNNRDIDLNNPCLCSSDPLQLNHKCQLYLLSVLPVGLCFICNFPFPLLSVFISDARLETASFWDELKRIKSVFI